jgi:HTH-type transcriptional regulator, repressor for puuD
MSDQPVSDPKVLRPGEVPPFDRGSGVKTVPLIGKWNNQGNKVTTGITIFAPGTALPLHTHNVEETVIVLEGEATAVIGEERHDLVVEDVTWVPAGVPHCFINRGPGQMRIYWVYGGYYVTRTICATGETFEHLSELDRGGTKA